MASISPGVPNPGSRQSKNWRNLAIMASSLLGSSALVNVLLIGIFCWGFFNIYKKRVNAVCPESHVTDSVCHSFTYKELAARCMLKLFIDFGKNEPRFFRMQLMDVVNTMFKVAKNKSSEEGTRHLAVEFVLTLVEAKEKAPGMMKKLPLFSHTFFKMMLNLLVDIKDKPSWYSVKTDLEEAGETPNYRLGVLCLDRFSIAFGGKAIAPIAMEQLSAYLKPKAGWRKHHAALIALVLIAEGCSKVMIKYLEQVVEMVLPSFKHPHPRVKWAAIQSFAQLSTDFCPFFQEQHHKQVLPALSEAIDDFENPRVQALAAISLRNFCRCEKLETCLPYLDGIIEKLRVLLQNDNQMVQEAALHALASIADLSKEHFHKYYDYVMPHMKDILVKANDKSNHMLQRNVVECISLVAMSVGKEKFRADLGEVMDLFKSSQESPVKEFETIVDILVACCRICLCIGKDILPYMNTVMPPLVECTQLEPNKTVPSDELGDSVHKVMFGDETICVRGRKLLEGKSLACSSLALYAQRLEEDFDPWLSLAASTLVPLLKFYIHDGVRESASFALSSLLRSAKLAVEKGTAQCRNESHFKQLSGDIIQAMGDALYSEPKTRVCASILHVMNKCLMICGSFLNEGQLRSIVDAIKYVITESSCRKGELTERAKLEDFDAEEAELMREERELEVKVFRDVGDILMTLIKTFKTAFLPFIDELSSYLLPIRDKDKSAEERNTCISVFVNLVEHCGEAALKYYNIYTPFILDACNDESPELRQIIPAWLNCLPIKGDRVEAKVVHGQLCSMLERSDRELLGPKYQHFTKLLLVFAEVLCAGKDLATKETGNRLIILLRNLQRTVPAATWASAWSLLLPQQEMELESILSPAGDANFSSVQ